MVKVIANISPVRYAVERVFRRIVSKTAFQHPLLAVFSFTLGDWECAKILALMSVTFWIAGWMLLVYKSNRM